jgi:hypothetical protein
LRLTTVNRLLPVAQDITLLSILLPVRTKSFHDFYA